MLNLGKSSSLRQHLIRSASGSLILKIANTALGLLLAVVLARVLGVEGFGIYAFCMSMVQILTVPAMLGGQQLLVREVAAYQTKGEYNFLRGLLTRFRQASFLASVLLALAAAGVVYIFYQDSQKLAPFLIALCMVPLLSAVQLHGAALRGLRYILYQPLTQALRPALVIVIVGSIYWFIWPNPGPEVAVSAQLAGTAFLALLTYLLLCRLLPREAKNAQPGYETSRWVKSALPFVFASGMQILNKETSIVMLGVLQEPEDVGLFRVAQRGALLIPFGLQAVNMAIAPTISQMFTNGEKERLQRMISKSIMAIIAFAIPVTLILIIGGKWILSFIFGPEYAPAYLLMVVLCLGQLINAGMGSVGIILNMAGLERFTANGVAIAAVANVGLNGALIPKFGAIGAAIATSISLMIWNVMLFIWLYRETGVLSTIIISRK
jgi:O-antigen/teichoic acid export membrane protein